MFYQNQEEALGPQNSNSDPKEELIEILGWNWSQKTDGKILKGTRWSVRRKLFNAQCGDDNFGPHQEDAVCLACYLAGQWGVQMCVCRSSDYEEAVVQAKADVDRIYWVKVDLLSHKSRKTV